MARIVETDYLDGDYPGEQFLNIPPVPADRAACIAQIINQVVGCSCSRFWKVVDNDYKLRSADPNQ